MKATALATESTDAALVAARRAVCPIRGCSKVYQVAPRNYMTSHIVKAHSKSSAARGLKTKTITLEDLLLNRKRTKKEVDEAKHSEIDRKNKRQCVGKTPEKSVSVDLDAALEVAIEAAKLAGRIIFLKHGEGMTSEAVKEKGSKGSVDVVTETDEQCQRICFDTLRRSFPSHMFIGEENTETDPITSKPTWICDPIDGTHNFVHGQKHVCVCIGLAIEKSPVLGVVFNPVLNELFTGIRGRGAFCNGERIRCNKYVDRLDRAMISTGIGHSRSDVYLKRTFQSLNSVVRYPCQCVRMVGSCALGMCDVARGTSDVYYEFDVGGLWDTAAAAIIVTESGALACHPDGTPFQLKAGKQQILCTNAKLVSEMCVLPGFS